MMTEKTSGQAAPASDDPNNKFVVMEYKINNAEGSAGKVRVYLLNVGDCFQRFGGSSAGLVVRKSASLIVSDWWGGSRTDREFAINDINAWERVFKGYRMSLGFKE